MNELARRGTKPCDCQQCRLADEAFGFDGTAVADTDAQEPEARAGKKPPSCPCSVGSKAARADVGDEAFALDAGGDEADEQAEDEDEDLAAEAEEEAEEVELDAAEFDDEELADFAEEELDQDAMLSDDEDLVGGDRDDADDAFDQDALDEDQDGHAQYADDQEESDEAAGEDAVDFEELLTDSSFDAPELEAESDDLEVRHLKPACPGVRRISVRKDAGGGEPFSQSRQAELCAAALLALRQAARAWKVIQAVWRARGLRHKKARWRNNPTLVKWFGSRILTRRQIRVVRRRLHRILRSLQRGIWFVVVQEESGKRKYGCGDANAYTRLTVLSRTFLCPPFFERSDAAQAKTIIHEQTHKLGFGHQTLPGRGKVAGAADVAKALELAKVKPLRARRNPLNVAEFILAV